MTRSQLDLSALLEAGDLPLGVLTDEEHEVLWFAERLEEDPERAPLLRVALKSLLATERVRLVDGEVELDEGLAIVRQCLDASGGDLALDLDDGTRLTWVAVEGDVLLQGTWSPYGYSHYVLRRKGEALSALVASLLPAGPAPDLDGTFPSESSFVVRAAEGGEETRLVLRHGDTGGYLVAYPEGVAGPPEPIDRIGLRRRLNDVLGS